jgi:low affinity Fe/Cu permease
MMGGMASMMGSPVGLVVLVLLVIIGLLLYGFS